MFESTNVVMFTCLFLMQGGLGVAMINYIFDLDKV